MAKRGRAAQAARPQTGRRMRRLSDLRKPKAAASGLMSRSVDVRTRVRIPGTLSADWTTPTPMNAVDAVHVAAVEGPGATMARVQCAASEADRLAAGSLLREQASPPAEYQAEGFAGRERYRVSSRVLGNGSYGVVWCATACAMCMLQLQFTRRQRP